MVSRFSDTISAHENRYIQIKKNQPRVFNARLTKFIKKHKKVYNVRRMERQQQVVLCRCFLIYFIISDCIVGFCWHNYFNTLYSTTTKKHLNNSRLAFPFLLHNQRLLYFLYRDLHWINRSFYIRYFIFYDRFIMFLRKHFYTLHVKQFQEYIIAIILYNYRFLIKKVYINKIHFAIVKLFANSFRHLYYKFSIAQGKFLYKCK